LQKLTIAKLAVFSKDITFYALTTKKLQFLLHTSKIKDKNSNYVSWY